MAINTAPSFFRSQSTGIINKDFGGSTDEARVVVVQADGKLVTCGMTNFGSPPAWKVGLVRYNADGTIDTTFGNGGVTTLYLGKDAQTFSMSMSADGSFLLTGDTYDADGFKLIVARVLNNGALDLSFGENGIATLGSADRAAGTGIVTLADSKILVVGHVESGKGIDHTYNFVVTRFTSSGQLDKTFGQDGVVLVDFNSGYDNAPDVLIQADGKIILAGTSEGNNGIGLVRLLEDGAIDTSFGSGGKFDGSLFPASGSLKGISADIAGNLFIVAGGFDGFVDGKYNGGFLVAKLNRDGQVDRSFGNDGFVNTDFGALQDIPNDIIVQPDGKVLAAGWSANGINNFFAIARYNPNGSLDQSFGDGGKLLLKAGINTSSVSVLDGDIAFKLAMQNDGKILVTGKSFNGTNSDFALVRLNQDGSFGTNFGEKGTVDTLGGSVGFVNKYPAVIIDPDVKIYDAELAALNGGKGNYAGASVKLQRETGGLTTDEYLATGLLSFREGHAYLGDLDLGIVEGGLGFVKITFNSNATQEKVNNVLSSIGYRSDALADATHVKIAWEFDDGNQGAQGSAGAMKASGISTINAFMPDLGAPYWIDALVRSDYHLDLIKEHLQSSRAYLYNFLTNTPDYGSAYDGKGFVAATSEQKNLINKAFSYIEGFTNLHFVETANPAQDSTIAIANYELPIGLGASAYYPETAYVGSDINLNAVDPSAVRPEEQSFFSRIFLHELGHALGLQHPFENSSTGRVLSSSEDSTDNTVMSYMDTLASRKLAYADLDIAALQFVYGVNPSARAGDDTYVLSNFEIKLYLGWQRYRHDQCGRTNLRRHTTFRAR